MAKSCMLITAVPKEYKKWYINAKKTLEEMGSPVSNDILEKRWLDHITNNDSSGVMAYIHHPDRGARTAIQFGKSAPKETLVLGTKRNNDGSITVATLDGVYTFNKDSEVSRNTYNKMSVTMPIMKDIDKQASIELSGFGVPFNVLSSQANKWASDYFMVGMSKRVGGLVGPLIEKAHVKAKQKSDLYRSTVNLIADGYRDSEFVAKMKVLLKVSGDINDKDLAKAVTVAYNNARMTKEVLDTKLPELDKWVKREMRNKQDQKNLNVIFGRSGFMHLMDNQDLLAKLSDTREEINIDELINSIPHNKMQMREAEMLAGYMVDGVVNGKVNAGVSHTVEQLAALLVLKEPSRLATFKKLRNNSPELYVEILRLSGMVKSMHEVIYKGKRNSVGKGSGKVYTGYDGYGMMDVYEGMHEYKYVSKEELNEVLKDPRWKLIRKPEGSTVGIVARESLSSYQEGLGLDKDVIRNGVPLDSNYVKDMVNTYGGDWLAKNNIVGDSDNGYPRYRIILTSKEKALNGYMDNIAHTLYRTWVHNAQVIEMQTVQDMVTENMTAKGDVGVVDMEKAIARNNKAEVKTEIKPFLDTEMTYDELKEKYPNVYKRYTPAKNISNYGNMREKITYVRKDMEDVLIGYSTGSIFKDDTTFGVTLQRIETVYKQLVQMLKLKLVVANPAKLAMDTISNTTLLMSMDVGIDEIAKKFPEALKYANEMSELEGKLVLAKLELAKAEATAKSTTKYQLEVDNLIKEIEKHPFYPAIKNGFIQSQGTSMLVKEFDTISGLQKTIDDVVKLVVTDKQGNPNKMHDAIVWLMNAGFSVDNILNSVSNMSKVKGTTFGEELEGIAKRLEEKKGTDVIRAEERRLGRKLTEDEIKDIQNGADTVRYVSEFIAAPSSELVRQGSRVMQMADIMGRWALYTHEMKTNLKNAGYVYESEYKAQQDIEAGRLDKKIYESIEGDAAIKALDTFIDYRLNLPKELKVLSDYGVLMFPAFWIRAQKVIYNLAKYHPINAGAGLLATDLLGLNGASIVDANVVNKIMNGTLIQAGQDVLKPGTIVLGL